MQSIEILDIKLFMQHLFQSSLLDSYEFISADICTDITYQLEGRIHKDFFTPSERESLSLEVSSYLLWETMKERVFTLIKGKKTPLRMKIVLGLTQNKIQSFLSATHANLTSSDIDGMYLNILFQEGKLTIVCGVSYKIFTLEKALENEFTNCIKSSLQAATITCQ